MLIDAQITVEFTSHTGIKTSIYVSFVMYVLRRCIRHVSAAGVFALSLPIALTHSGKVKVTHSDAFFLLLLLLFCQGFSAMEAERFSHLKLVPVKVAAPANISAARISSNGKLIAAGTAKVSQ